MIADHPTPKYSTGGVAYTLNSRDYKGEMVVVISEDNRINNGEQSSGQLLRSGCVQRYVEKRLLHRQRSSASAVSEQEGRSTELLARSAKSIEGGCNEMDIPTVRRLTPEECERLQGFPDNWTLIGEPEINKNGETEYFYIDSQGKKKKVSDSARYKALGNSICTPFWKFLARRICAQYERDVTIGSLFDGIGGFPYVFEQCGAIPVWASEIEEFPIAVTKEHFPED